MRLRHRTAGDTDEDVGARERLLQRTGDPRLVGDLRELALDVRQVVPVTGHDALAVGDRDIAETRLQQELGDGDTGRARAGDHRAQVAERAPGEPGGVPQGRESDDRGPVLVVVEDGNVQSFLEPALDLEAPRCRDVLQIDAAERGSEPDHRLDDLVDAGAGERDRHRVHTAELLEQDGLALHDGERGLRADVTEPEHCRPVGHHSDHGRLPRVVVDEFRLLGDRAAHLRDAGRVSQGQVVLVADGHSGLHSHLAAAVQRESRVEGIEGLRPAFLIRTAVAARIDDLRCHFVLPLKSSLFEGDHSWLRGGRAPRRPCRRGCVRAAARRARRTRALSPG